MADGQMNWSASTQIGWKQHKIEGDGNLYGMPMYSCRRTYSWLLRYQLGQARLALKANDGRPKISSKHAIHYFLQNNRTFYLTQKRKIFICQLVHLKHTENLKIFFSINQSMSLIIFSIKNILKKRKYKEKNFVIFHTSQNIRTVLNKI